MDNENNNLLEEDKFKGEFHEKDSHRVNDIVSEISDSFLDYSMSVITSRAIPDLRDGLKPVHRRILWSMFEEGNTPDKPHKKSATTVGTVILPLLFTFVVAALVLLQYTFLVCVPLAVVLFILVVLHVGVVFSL